jgi:hypothetical protein
MDRESLAVDTTPVRPLVGFAAVVINNRLWESSSSFSQHAELRRQVPAFKADEDGSLNL